MHRVRPSRSLGHRRSRRAAVLLSALVLGGAGTVGDAPAQARAGVPTCHGSPATIVGTAGDDTLKGTGGADVIVGGGGLDVIHGGPGDDVICGGSTRVDEDDEESRYQTLDGDAGDDVLVGGDGEDYLFGSAGADLLIGHGTLDYLYGGAGKDTLRGGPGDDQLSGDDDADRVFGDAGDDEFDDFGGANLLEGGDGSDVFASGAGDDTIRGGDGRDTVTYVAALRRDGWGTHCHAVAANLESGRATGTGFGTDVLRAVENVRTGGGNDVLVGDDEDNQFYTGDPGGCLEGQPRVESVTGNGGVDEISFDSWTAEYSGDPGPVHVDLSAHIARWLDGRAPAVVLTLRGVENVTGTEFRDLIVGDAHPNRLVGRASADTLSGRGGNDRLFGGSGRNRNNGGGGIDTCRLPRHGRLAVSCER